jgi:hypothetical protein
MPEAGKWRLNGGRLNGSLNALGIFAATSLVIFYFEVSPLWYSAALLAWIVRWQTLYRGRTRAREKLSQPVVAAADQTAENL